MKREADSAALPEFTRLQHDSLWLEIGHRFAEQRRLRKEAARVSFPLTLTITGRWQPGRGLASPEEAAECLLGCVCDTDVAPALSALRRKKEINLRCVSPITTLAAIFIQTLTTQQTGFLKHVLETKKLKLKETE